MLDSTVRIRYERESNGRTFTGHGTAFGVDLSQYGYPASRHCLLTAAHNVLDDNKVPYSTLKIELRKGDNAYWSQCRAVAWDEYLDLCIVESDDDLPNLLRLAASDPKVGSRLVLAGSPRGVPVGLFAGTLNRKFERGTARSSATVPFVHGDSGGPMVDPVSGLVVGVAVAGLPKG
ncbi:MAG: serine protease, partial [Planctomycetota bacterium]